MRIEGSQSGGWLQVEFLKCSISEMTNSLFEKADVERVREQEEEDGVAGLLPVFNDWDFPCVFFPTKFQRFC